MSEVSTFAFQYHDNCTTYAICYWYLCSDLFLFFFFPDHPMVESL